MKCKLKKNLALTVLIIALVVVLVGSIAAQAFNTSGYTVDVSRIYFETDSGTLSGLLYLPKGASAEDPRPTIVTTHGYLNSAEMQDAPAIELSRRGYVVLAMDMYDHGHSKGNEEHTGNFLTFWPTSIYDGVQYMYQQDYVMKDENGNGVIAVSGHSMGGFSSTMALYYDELTYEQVGIRMITAGLSAGSDYSYTAWLGLDAATAVTKFGGRTIGKIAAHYDEFFFNAAGAEGTVNYKDYVSTEEGQTILETTDAKADTWYDTADGGKRIIYEPSETHPWNHFSKTTTAHMIDFYEVAFEKYDTSSIKDIASNNQIWFLKELCECVAMIGFLVALAALAALLLKAPFLKNAKSGEALTTAPVSTLGGKIGSVALFVVSMLIPAIIYATLNGSSTAESMRWLNYAGIIAAVLGVVSLILALISKDEGKKSWILGSVTVNVAGACLAYLTGTKNTLFSNNQIFQAGTVSTIATWAMVCAFISVIIMVSMHLFGGKKEKGVTLAHYGLSAKIINVVASLVIAVIVVAVGYGLLFLVDALFTTDFRIWTFAFKTFEASAIPAALKYMPFFFIYYLVSGAAAVSNTSSEKLQGVKGYVLASLTNMGGITLWLVLQYGKVFATGSAFYASQALSGIILVALVPTLIVSSCFTKYLYKKTGNVYLAAFLNTILLTMMTVANTTVYWQ